MNSSTSPSKLSVSPSRTHGHRWDIRYIWRLEFAPPSCCFFGLKTYRALVTFQKANGLPATGFFGPLTRAAIAGMSTSAAQ